MITVDGLTVEFGGTTLFKDISFQINEKDRIALMGKNGAGKSTLLKIIAGVRKKLLVAPFRLLRIASSPICLSI